MEQTKLFEKSSTTYSNSTLFFGEKEKEKITILYGFLRYIDNLVDNDSPDPKELEKAIKQYRTGEGENNMIKDFIALKKECGFEEEWITSFLESMKQDLHKKSYETIKETKQYIYGSAEVVGLMMAKILNLPKESYAFAQKQGMAMQYINMIRDIAEDIEFGRNYIPKEEMKKHGLNSLDEETAKANKEKFEKLIRSEIKRYYKWQKEAEKGYKYIPRKYLVPIKTAVDMYNWTAKKIYEDPLIIYREKVKPKKSRVILTAIKNKVTIWKN